MYVGYGAAAAERGLVGVTVEHRLYGSVDYDGAVEDVRAAVEYAQKLDGVDPDRVALWFFSGGGLLATDWLAAPPSWLRCVALTYPVLAPVLPLAPPHRPTTSRHRPCPGWVTCRCCSPEWDEKRHRSPKP